MLQAFYIMCGWIILGLSNLLAQVEIFYKKQKEWKFMTLPVIFKERMKNLLGSGYDSFISSYENGKTQGLRINTLKEDIINRDRLPFQLESIPWAEEGFYYNASDRPGLNPLHEAGVYYIQEPSAMSVVSLLAPEKGDFICDLCAAPGGKSTQIAARLGGTGLLVPNEISLPRAMVLSQNIERSGIVGAFVCNETPGRLACRFPEFFDKIVVDAPCSGEGMFRKDSRAVEEWNAGSTGLCAKRQQDILDCAEKMLKPGGILVYSTCTFSPLENEDILIWFLRKYPGYNAEDWKTSVMAEYINNSGCKGNIPDSGRADFVSGSYGSLSQKEKDAVGCAVRFWPHKIRGEGHFAVRLRKHSSTDAGIYSNSMGNTRKNKKKTGNIPKGQLIASKKDSRELENFLKEIFIDVDISRYVSRMVFYGDNLYLLPEGIDNTDGIKFVRPGLHIAVRMKNRYEPAHALSRVAKPGDARQYQDCNYETALRFLHGETIQCNAGYKGWVLVGYGGFPLGWAKAGSGMAKNHYPKGLRI